MSNEALEKEIQEKGLTAPRITPEHIESILSRSIAAYHVFDGSQLTVCCLTLPNGFTLTGESACASPENFDEEIGRKIALKQAADKLWMLEGYVLKQRLYETASISPPLDGSDMPTWQESVLYEKEELAAKLDKLTKFLYSDDSNEVAPVELDLLNMQKDYMTNYVAILDARIVKFNLSTS